MDTHKAQDALILDKTMSDCPRVRRRSRRFRQIFANSFVFHESRLKVRGVARVKEPKEALVDVPSRRVERNNRNGWVTSRCDWLSWRRRRCRGRNSLT